MSRDYRDTTLNHIAKKSKTMIGYNDSGRPIAEWRITELLEHNLKIGIEEQKTQQQRPTEGDIATLALRKEFFMGIAVGWPYPMMMKPQRLMSMHIIKGLNASRHVVLESPTGTGMLDDVILL